MGQQHQHQVFDTGRDPYAHVEPQARASPCQNLLELFFGPLRDDGMNERRDAQRKGPILKLGVFLVVSALIAAYLAIVLGNISLTSTHTTTTRSSPTCPG